MTPCHLAITYIVMTPCHNTETIPYSRKWLEFPVKLPIHTAYICYSYDCSHTSLYMYNVYMQSPAQGCSSPIPNVAGGMRVGLDRNYTHKSHSHPPLTICCFSVAHVLHMAPTTLQVGYFILIVYRDLSDLLQYSRHQN